MRSRRYDLGFWEQLGGHRIWEEEDGDVLEQTRLDNQRDLERCRALLLEMTEEDLHEILMRSRFNVGGSATEHNAAIDAHKAVDDKWLDEAAAAYHVPITCIKLSAQGRVRNSSRRQADVVNDVIVEVRKARHCLRGAAADKDIRRKHELMETMSDRFGLSAAAKACHIHRRRGEAAAALKERILLRSCPEDLRIAVASEFVAQHGRLPNAELDAERSVRQYVDSALARRWLTTDSGEQLTQRHISEWDAVFERIAESGRPAWEEDPVFLMVQRFYTAHGHLCVPKAKRGTAMEAMPPREVQARTPPRGRPLQN